MRSKDGRQKPASDKKYFNDAGPVNSRELETEPQPGKDHRFIDDIYDIALDPENLDAFIERLGTRRLDVEKVRTTLRKVEVLGHVFKSHITRAESILERLDDAPRGTPLERILAPFDTTAAMIVNSTLQIVALNSIAEQVFSIQAGDPVDMLPFEENDSDQLMLSLRRLLRQKSANGKLIHLKSSTDAGRVVVFHAKWCDPSWVEDTDPVDTTMLRSSHVLLASTELHWPPALDQTLQEVFGLTDAERDIVRALVDGKALKVIARDRGRSLGTVRTQLKSVLSKTRAHSQSELIRVTLSLMDVIERSPELTRKNSNRPPVGTLSSNNQAAQPPAYIPYSTLTLQDGRKLDYLVQGPDDGNPIIFSHMGYGLARWHPPALKLAEQHQLKVVTPVRSGFGKSDPVKKSDDILAVTRNDTLVVMDKLGIERCPYVVQGNDMLFALDFAAEHSDRVSEIIGLGGRLPLPSETQYAGMGKWHHFLLSNARYAPHLLYFTTKAAFALARKVGREKMFLNIHRDSPADLSVANDPELAPTLLEASRLTIDDDTHAAFAYAHELLETESDWSERVEAARDTPIRFVSGLQDPLGDAATVAAYRDRFPWIDIDVVEDAGQLLFFQKYRDLVPDFARAAQCIQPS